MKTPLIFLAGIALGWLGAVTFQASEPSSGEFVTASANGVNHRSASNTVASNARTRRQPDRLAPARAYDDAFEARLKAATSENLEIPPIAPTPNLSDARFSGWLAAAALSDALRGEIRKRFEALLVTSDADPLVAGSEFDLWLSERLEADSLGAWETLREEHAADTVERRANQLLVGLQGALSLNPSQKDALYAPLVEWVRQNPPDLTGSQESAATQSFNELAAMIPADQQDALADWMAEFLPSYWLQESGVE